MKELKKRQLNINGIIFNIFSDYVDEIDNYFKNFIVECNDKKISEFNIYFDNDISSFKKLYNNFDLKNSIIIPTFKNQIHYQNENQFLIDTEDYICLKHDEYNYKVFGNNEKDSYRGLSWIIRELLIRELEDNRYYYMHGTGIKIGDKGILLLGNSGSGKTTFATKINEIETSQQLISNDRVFVKNGVMHYYPLSIMYAMGTVKNNENLNEYFQTQQVLEKQQQNSYESISLSKKCSVPLTSITSIFPNVNNTASSIINAIIFPKLSDQNYIREPSTEEKITMLNETNFTPHDIENERREWIKYRKLSTDEIFEQKKEFNKELISNIPILEVFYSPSISKNKFEKVLKKI